MGLFIWIAAEFVKAPIQTCGIGFSVVLSTGYVIFSCCNKILTKYINYKMEKEKLEYPNIENIVIPPRQMTKPQMANPSQLLQMREKRKKQIAMKKYYDKLEKKNKKALEEIKQYNKKIEKANFKGKNQIKYKKGLERETKDYYRKLGYFMGKSQECIGCTKRIIKWAGDNVPAMMKNTNEILDTIADSIEELDDIKINV